MFDKVTEIVAHMIGVFHIAIEEARMRDVYAQFQAAKLEDPAVEDLLNISVKISAPYTLTDFSPSVEYTPSAADYFFAPDGYGLYLADLFYQPLGQLALIEGSPDGQAAPLPFFPARSHLTLEPPGSVATITAQVAWMEDDDELYLNEEQAEFVDPSTYLTSLHSLALISKALGATTSEAPLDFSESTLSAALEFYEAISAVEDASRIGETVTVSFGADAQGNFVNGETVEETPVLDDVMPAYFQAENPDVTLEEEESDTEEDGDALADTDPFQGLDGSSSDSGTFEIDDGHNVVTGANVMVNDASVMVGWLDAPVISVMGDVVELNSISQVNVLFEQVSFNGETAASASATINVAVMSNVSSMPAVEDGSTVEDTTPQDLGLPDNWAVTRIDGDILTVNWVSQFSFMTDNDRADVQFTGTNTQIVMGDNTIANVVDLAEIGYGYDLIMIGGNLITINQISQTNVMMDYDTVTSSNGVPVGYSGGDNLLFNGASITNTGLDTYGEMTDNFAKASDAFAQGANSITTDVAHDGAFAGDDVLTVLYISGDLTTINWMEQTNVMGDSDQVHLALENFAEETGAEINLTTGSNAAINLANIDTYGIDSEVRVGGDVYSEALLYQADLIDTDADPLGVALPALANEAVAFLADNMIGPETDTTNDTEIIATPPENSAGPDLMQTMLA
ncbi:conserved hypothetical protein [Ruegeria sp. TrichCH4B]|nr:conserved hypothetical protein [Ruegeria sp. TrichCH4B]